MAWFLRQSTASQEVLLGPFVASSDGYTAQTGLTIANTDIKLFATGATSEASKNSGGATHVAGGRYYTVLDAVDSATIGPLRLSVQMTNCLAVWLECVVLAANVYDTLFGTTALSTYAGADTSGTTTLLSRVTGAVLLASGYTAPPSAATVADAVWDELLAGHQTTLTAGYYITQILSAIPQEQSIITGVWQNPGRTLTSFGFTVDADFTPVLEVLEPMANDLTAVKAAVYDSLTVSGNELTLSTGATQTINLTTGARTTAEP